MTNDLGGCEDLPQTRGFNHTGAHKINNVLGQALLAKKKMGKTRLIAETGAGQHGVATATAAALMGMECVVFMGVEDTERQALNVYRMRLLGAGGHPGFDRHGTLKDACSAAFREWISRIDDTHYCLGSCMGPHPFPTIVRDFSRSSPRRSRSRCSKKEGMSRLSKGMGERTIFNVLRPGLSNPARATMQLLGVYDESLRHADGAGAE